MTTLTPETLVPEAALEKYRLDAEKLRRFLAFAGRGEGTEQMALDLWDALAADRAVLADIEREVATLRQSLRRIEAIAANPLGSAVAS